MLELKVKNEIIDVHYNLETVDDIETAYKNLKDKKSDYISRKVKTNRKDFKCDSQNTFKENIGTFEAIKKMLDEIHFIKNE